MTPDVLAEVVATVVKTALAPLQTRVAVLEGQVAAQSPIEAMKGVHETVGALRERVAVVEVRQPIPGPAGQDGAAGANGKDGLGFEDLAVEYDGDRTLTLKFARIGLEEKRFPIVLPFLRYQGVYQAGASYAEGDTVTWAGSLWHCKAAATVRRPGEGGDWTLVVKRGQDGKDAKP